MRRIMAFAAGAALSATGVATARPTYTAAGPVPIVDAGTGGCSTLAAGPAATLDVGVPDTLTITKVTVGVHITHTWQGDLKFMIQKVGAGTPIVLVDRPNFNATVCGFSADNYGASSTALFVLDDAALTTYDSPQVFGAGTMNVAGLWKPESSLGAFNGMSSQGTWRLSVVDNATLDTGAIQFVSLTIEGSAACYPDCNQSGTLTIADFACFQNAFVAQHPYADCNNTAGLTIADFACFQNAFVQGCP